MENQTNKENVIKRIEGRKFTLNKSYFKNNVIKGHPDSILDIARYHKIYGELPFDYSGDNWLYDAMSARQKQHGLQNDQYLTPDSVAKQLVELTNNFIPKDNRVLNACCGIGQLAKYLLDNKFNVYGYDNDRQLVDVCSLVYPEATFLPYDFCRDNRILAESAKVQYWDLIVSNPPGSKVNVTSFISWLSRALSDEGKAIILMHNDFEYKNYNKLYKSHVGRFKILRKEEIEDTGSDPVYAGMRIYLMELDEGYKKERAQEISQGLFIEKDHTKTKDQMETENITKEKTQIMERQDLKKIQYVRLDRIVLNPLNPRKKIEDNDILELARSIQSVGLLQAITLRKKGDNLEIVAGECRYRAFCLNGEETIPAVIGEYTDEEVMFLALAENIVRKNLSLLEEANAFYYLILEYKYSIEDLAIRFGRNDAYIRNRLRLLSLIPDFKNLLEKDELSIGASIELSKYAAAIQQEVYDNYFRENNHHSWHSLSKKELASRLVRLYTMTLDDYEFNKDECKTCRYNTDTNTLFDECKGKCTNPECLRSKQQQHTLDTCKSRVEEYDFEIIVSPADKVNAVMAEKLKEEGIEIKTSVTYEAPEQPQKPKRENFKLECDYTDALEEYKMEDLEYNAEMDEYEKKVEQGEYKRCLYIGGNNPTVCYAPVKKDDKEKTVAELEQQAKANYETTKSNIVKASLDLVRTKEIPATEFTVLEEEIFLFLMLGYVNKKHFPLFGITETNKECLADKDREQIISGITNGQYGFLKREFILKYMLSLNMNKLTPKLQVYLQSFAQQHFAEEAETIVKKQLDIFNKTKEKIDKQIKSIKAKPSPATVKS